MKVIVPKGKLNYFRRKALNSDTEQLAFLIGHECGGGVVVVDFKYPQLVESTPVSVAPDDADYERIKRDAEASGELIIGSIHSHPNYIPVMSEQDFGGHLIDREIICGIVGTTPERKTHVCFWSAHSALPCELVYA